MEPGFKTRLHRKDMHIALAAARHLHLDLPATALLAEHLEWLCEHGFAEADSAAIVKSAEACARKS